MERINIIHDKIIIHTRTTCDLVNTRIHFLEYKMLIYQAHLLLDCVCVSVFYVSSNGPNDFPMLLLKEKLLNMPMHGLIQ